MAERSGQAAAGRLLCTLEAADRALTWAERLGGVALLLLVLGLIFAQVVARYVFQAPFFWSDELARYSYVWMAFITAAYVASKREHIRVDVLHAALGRRGQRVVDVFASLVVVVTCLLLVYGSWNWLMTNVRPRSPALRMPLVWLYGVVWAAFILIALHSLVDLARRLVGGQAVGDDKCTQ